MQKTKSPNPPIRKVKASNLKEISVVVAADRTLHPNETDTHHSQPSPPPIVLSTHARTLLQGEYGDARIRSCLQHGAVARVEPFHHLPVPVGQRTPHRHVHVLKGDAVGEHGRPPVVHLYVGGKLQIGDVQPAKPLAVHEHAVDVLGSRQPQFRQV